MRYFRVEKQLLAGEILSGEIFSDGEFAELPEMIEPQAERELGFVVYELDESGVVLDTIYGLTLDEIKEQYSADNGWQNHNW